MPLIASMSKLEDDLKGYLEDFVKLCYLRLEKGSTEGKDFRNADLYNQIIEELADISNYAFLQYVKIRSTKEKNRQLEKKG
jgi:hypothetical protein